MRAATCNQIRAAMRWIMAAFCGAAGALHIAAPERLLPIVPDIVPFPRMAILITGVCEIAAASALGGLRRVGGAALALYAASVFPANLKEAFSAVHIEGLPNSWWYHGPRPAAQPVRVCWALFCASIVDSPFAPAPRGPAP